MMLDFIETNICKGATHAKLLRQGKITETLFIDLSKKPSTISVQVLSAGDFSKVEYEAYLAKYKSFDSIEDSRLVAQNNGGYAEVWFYKENVKDILTEVSAIPPYIPK
ncbi:hypothetical protein [Massilia sp. WG5]|uniref:hypothetical protein n=1 Tax=Massilia sp. WG5 TaxID=1707785 RepID=UPI0013A5338D|nr:hypothetical protein [Massilia sp. WG5]